MKLIFHIFTHFSHIFHSLAHNRVGDEGSAVLAEGMRFGRKPGISSGSGTDTGTGAGGSTGIRSTGCALTKLNLADNRLTACTGPLSNALLHTPSLRQLCLNHNDVGAAGVSQLAYGE